MRPREFTPLEDHGLCPSARDKEWEGDLPARLCLNVRRWRNPSKSISTCLVWVLPLKQDIMIDSNSDNELWITSQSWKLHLNKFLCCHIFFWLICNLPFKFRQDLIIWEISSMSSKPSYNRSLLPVVHTHEQRDCTAHRVHLLCQRAAVLIL